METRKKKVLVVDDDAAIRNILCELLASPRVEVFAVGSCEAARAMVAKARFDAILLDNSLPDGCGVDLLPGFAQVCPRLLMLTANPELVEASVFARGAEAVFAKPFDESELFSHIYRLWNIWQ